MTNASLQGMALNLEPENQRPGVKKSKYKVALGLGSVVGIFGIGSTLAANISLNNGGNVEFGQGVANTAACDEDGFTITPITSYYSGPGVFKVDRIEISGLNLTPQGTGWEDAGYIDQDAAIADRPGEYWDEIAEEWVRTCDGVVLDFKAYTDDEDYLNRTDTWYTDASLDNPIGWYQYESDETDNAYPGFAIVIDTDESGYTDSNYGLEVNGAEAGYTGDFNWEVVDNINTDDASFAFWVYNDNNKTLAGSISKITVQSMATFPSSYYADHEGLGSPTSWG